jgi:hypothetical protein
MRSVAAGRGDGDLQGDEWGGKETRVIWRSEGFQSADVWRSKVNEPVRLALVSADGSAADLRERKQRASAKKLYFDLETGDLLMGENVTDRRNPVIDQIYEDGFFA